MIALGIFSNGSYGDGINNVPGAVTGLLSGNAAQLAARAIGVAENIAFASVTQVFFKGLDRIIPLRASEEVAFEVLDQEDV